MEGASLEKRGTYPPFFEIVRKSTELDVEFERGTVTRVRGGRVSRLAHTVSTTRRATTQSRAEVEILHRFHGAKK